MAILFIKVSGFIYRGGLFMFVPTIQNEQTDLLVKAILSLATTEEAYRFFEDLCTIQEFKTLAQRITVAQMLENGNTYQDIANQTGAGTATITRVNKALQYGAKGYQNVLNAINNSSGEIK